MGDINDLNNDLKEHRGTHRQTRLTQAAAMIEDVRSTVDSITVDSSGTWNVVKGPHKIQFYPTKGTWQYNQRMYHGGIFPFINWMAKL